MLACLLVLLDFGRRPLARSLALAREANFTRTNRTRPDLPLIRAAYPHNFHRGRVKLLYLACLVAYFALYALLGSLNLDIPRLARSLAKLASLTRTKLYLALRLLVQLSLLDLAGLSNFLTFV